MTDWIEHKAGAPQPVADDVWVMTPAPDMQTFVVQLAKSVPWRFTSGCFRIVNQHLIDATRLEGIRLGLEAAMKIVWKETRWMGSDGPRIGEKLWLTLRDINPDTIAREAVLDQLTSEAQADNMGYDND